MFNNKLDIMVVSETWIGESAPDSVRYGLASMGFNISHVYSSIKPGRPIYGARLAIITADDIIICNLKLQTTTCPASFELQLVNL